MTAISKLQLGYNVRTAVHTVQTYIYTYTNRPFATTRITQRLTAQSTVTLHVTMTRLPLSLSLSLFPFLCLCIYLSLPLCPLYLSVSLSLSPSLTVSHA